MGRRPPARSAFSSGDLLASLHRPEISLPERSARKSQIGTASQQGVGFLVSHKRAPVASPPMRGRGTTQLARTPSAVTAKIG